MLLSVNNKEQEEEEAQQHQHNDSGDDSNLVGVHLHGSASQTVEAAHHHTSLVAAVSLPARVAVARPGHVITGGVIQTVTHLAAAVTIGTSRAFLLTAMAHESRAAGAVSIDVVTVSSVPALAGLGTVFAIET